MALETMEDLLVHELRDLLNAEKQLLKALPKMAKKATNEHLIEALENHLAETEGQVERLEECFALLEMSPRGKKCEGMAGLIEEANSGMEEAEDEGVLDAVIIASAQRVEHYEMAAYGTARAFAERLGHPDVAELLQESLDEEGAANELLTSIAESEVNYEASSDEEEENGGNGGRKNGKSARRGSKGRRQAAAM